MSLDTTDLWRQVQEVVAHIIAVGSKRRGVRSDRPNPDTEGQIVKTSTSWSSLWLRRPLAFSNKKVSRGSSGRFLSRWQEPDTDAALAIQMLILYVPRKPRTRRDM